MGTWSDYGKNVLLTSFRLSSNVGKLVYYLYLYYWIRAALRHYILYFRWFLREANRESNWLHFLWGLAWIMLPIDAAFPWFHGHSSRYVLFDHLGGIPSMNGCLFGRRKAILRFAIFNIADAFSAYFLGSRQLSLCFRIGFSQRKKEPDKMRKSRGLINVFK